MRYTPKIILAAGIVLCLLACGEEGTTEPLEYPGESSVNSLLSSFSDAAESSSSENLVSSSSSDVLDDTTSEMFCVANECFMTDKRDGHVYRTVKLGSQTWMAENLNYEIANSSCKDNSADSCARYGRLYLWSTAMDSAGFFSTNGLGCGNGLTCSPEYPVRGICPEGWHLPREHSDTFVPGTLPFVIPTCFWTSTEGDVSWARSVYISGDLSGTGSSLKTRSFYVRCVKGLNAEQNLDLPSSSSVQSSSSSNESSSSSFPEILYGEMTDERDGRTYKIVTIGNLSWMVENLKYAYVEPTATLDSSSRCFGNVSENCEKYGRMYLWSAAMDSAAAFTNETKGCGFFSTIKDWYRCPFVENVRGVCPEGWRIPSEADHRVLMPWRIEHEDEFNEEQVHQHDGKFMCWSSFWLADEDDYAYGYRDAYNPIDRNLLMYTEENMVMSVKKQEFHSVRCVKRLSDSISFSNE